jgi:hypothetical protein
MHAPLQVYVQVPCFYYNDKGNQIYKFVANAYYLEILLFSCLITVFSLIEAPALIEAPPHYLELNLSP